MGDSDERDTLARIEAKLDRVETNLGLLGDAFRAFQVEIARAIPTLLKLDHLEEIKAQRKNEKEELSRSLTQSMYNWSLQSRLEEMRQKGERVPYHPGVVLKNRLGEPLHGEQGQERTRKLAAEMGINHSVLRKFLNGRVRVSLKLADVLSSSIGETPDYWLELQREEDAWWAKNPELKIAPELRQTAEKAVVEKPRR